jgi:hypothetical protein
MSVLKGLFTRGVARAETRPLLAPDEVAVEGVPPFPLRAGCVVHNGFPIPDWDAAMQWLEKLPEGRRSEAWTACERAWLLHFRDALGGGYGLQESKSAMLVSSLEPHLRAATLDYIEKTLRRVVAVLGGLAQVAPWGKDLLIVLDDTERYYEYVSYYYPERGDFAFSGGIYIHKGCSHFVTVKSDLRSIEPVIAHEMTHGCLAHLPLPLWLNEGLAVNTERRLAPQGQLYTPEQMHAKHLRFWRKAEIQEFWEGKSFSRQDDGNMLSYDLARIIVEQLANDWPRFEAFASAARFEDGGDAAAREHYGVDLGEIAKALLEQPEARGWAPNPQSWEVNPPGAPRSASTG